MIMLSLGMLLSSFLGQDLGKLYRLVFYEKRHDLNDLKLMLIYLIEEIKESVYLLFT